MAALRSRGWGPVNISVHCPSSYLAMGGPRGHLCYRLKIGIHTLLYTLIQSSMTAPRIVRLLRHLPVLGKSQGFITLPGHSWLVYTILALLYLIQRKLITHKSSLYINKLILKIWNQIKGQGFPLRGGPPPVGTLYTPSSPNMFIPPHFGIFLRRYAQILLISFKFINRRLIKGWYTYP